MPAKIVSYEFKSHRAEVKIDMKELYSDGTELDYPIISSVPVVFMISGGASITAPVREGDTCLVIFNDRDITNWLLGSTGERPESRRLHDINDAVAIMGLMPFTETSPAENNDDLLISYDGSKIRLKPNGNIDILNGSTINVETEIITINCANSIVNATDNVKINCQDVIVKATNAAQVECNEASIKATTNATVTCENSIIEATNNTSVKCKNSYTNASELVVVQAKDITIAGSENIVLTSKNTNVTTTEDISFTCVNATVTASGGIKTISPTLTHTGNLVVSGTTELTGALTTHAGITNTGGTTSSNGITLETHTHTYVDTIGEPPVPTPSVTGTPT